MVSKDLRSLWEQRLADHATSGKSMAMWCKEHSINKWQFYYWRKKLLDNPQAETDLPAKWLPLNVRQTDMESGSISIYVGQAVIEVKKDFDPHLLHQVLEVLQAL